MFISLYSGAQNHTTAYLTEAFRYESGNVKMFNDYAKQAETENLPEMALFFRAFSQSASIRANQFKKYLKNKGVVISDALPHTNLKETLYNLEDALYSVRIEAGIKYAEYLDEAEKEGDEEAVSLLKTAKESQQESLDIFIRLQRMLIVGDMQHMPSVYWVCPVCGNLYDLPEPEAVCNYCQTKSKKFIEIRNQEQ